MLPTIDHKLICSPLFMKTKPILALIAFTLLWVSCAPIIRTRMFSTLPGLNGRNWNTLQASRSIFIRLPGNFQ